MKVRTPPCISFLLCEKYGANPRPKGSFYSIFCEKIVFNMNASAIISDDKAFLNILHQNNIPFIIPTDLIVRLYELKIITMEEFMKALDMIKPYVSKHNYDRAKNSQEV